MGFNPKWILGKTVAEVEMNPFPARDHDRTVSHDPRIRFTDGSSIGFVTDETDGDAYGISIVYNAPPRKRPRPA